MNPAPSPRPLTIAAVLALLVSGAATPALAAPFEQGEILLSRYSANSAQRYSAAGSLLQTFTGQGLYWDGSAVTPDGKLVISHQGPTYGGLNIYDSAGTELLYSSDVDAFVVQDVSVFANGTLALNDQALKVRLFDQTGALLATVSTPGVSIPLGSTVGMDNVLYVAGSNSANFGRISQSGTFLGAVALPFNPAEIVMSPLDGTLWMTSVNDDTIYNVTTTGSVLGSFSSGLASNNNYGLGLAPDGLSLYTSSFYGTVIRHLSLTGTLLGDIAIDDPGDSAFLTVVQTPEPTSALLLGLGALGLLARRRR